MRPFLGEYCEERHRAATQFLTDGAIWLRDAIDPRLVQRLAKRFRKHYLSLGESALADRFACVGDSRYLVSVEIKGAFNSVGLFANPNLLPLMNQLLGQRIRISSFSVVVSLKGSKAQPVHVDYPPLFDDESVCNALPPHAITLIVPLTDLTPETGSTAIWLGSHNAPGSRDRLVALSNSESFGGSSVPLPKVGDAVLMDYRTIHAGTPNVSGEPRPILYIVYSRSWFNEHLNFAEQPPVNISPKQLARVPKKYRALFQ